jgi:integrase
VARNPEPRYRSDRRLWHVQLGGVQYVLARDDDFKGDRARAERHARREFGRLLGEWEAAKRAGRVSARKTPSLGAVAAAYFDDLKKRAGRREINDRVRRDYRGRVAEFLRLHGHRPADAITTAMIDDFLAEKAEAWPSPNTRADFARVLGTIYRWARRRGTIHWPPPVPGRPTGRKLKRDKVPSWGEVEAILGAIKAPEFRDFASFIAWTACRPSEAARLEPSHLSDGAATLIEHQTRGKTQAARVIIMPRPARAIAERRAGAAPTGPLFATPTGRAWTKDNWARHFRAAQARAGVDERITLYTFRHSRATMLLLGGATISEVAALLGNSPEMVARTYSDVVNQMGHLMRIAEIGVEPEDHQKDSSSARPEPPQQGHS